MNFSMWANIRKYFKPLQPAVNERDKVIYMEFFPHEALQNYIYCYWELKTTEKLAQPYWYRVVADGCTDIFFETKNPNQSFVMGFCKQFTEFPLGTEFHHIGVRFLPTFFTQFFHINAKELSNNEIDLTSVVPFLSEFIANQFYKDILSVEIKSIFDAFFLQLLPKISFNNDPRLYRAIAFILQNNGAIHLKNDLNTGISPRQLRRLFEFYIGDTAKTFSKVVRFQSVLNGKTSVQALCKTNLFLDLYYDQSHFIKEFKQFYGITPKEVLKR